jgi:hypothetical protein
MNPAYGDSVRKEIPPVQWHKRQLVSLIAGIEAFPGVTALASLLAGECLYGVLFYTKANIMAHISTLGAAGRGHIPVDTSHPCDAPSCLASGSPP